MVQMILMVKKKQSFVYEDLIIKHNVMTNMKTHVFSLRIEKLRLPALVKVNKDGSLDELKKEINFKKKMLRI